ncbi:hypothetical protein SAMN05444410_104204 [Hydrobacter penzbergensis]|uniref:Uncharacterized protein n=1 Tax=Hydrobacter penzbergensis TaxID=1235997 RepID=A0A8X8LD64_9BACT|nr:hypothetical protein [Hydrobacter penzbergensis]SDW64742.1 hypothetical protein SAMN05444410_104204 [Hydrobacter penzbergensis]
MTLIVSWIGVDDKKDKKEIASIYISSDSRYTWGNSGRYDYGIKVFGSTKFPEIFGFCGDVMFPSMILGQIIPQIDNGILLENSDNAEMKSDKIFSYISTSFDSYPSKFIGDSFTILHGTRFEKAFKLFKTILGPDKKLKKEEIFLGNISTKVFSGGSGAKEFDQNWLQWEREKHNDYRTSRAVYHCLHKTLKEIKDPQTGGLSQIVGLYRNKNARLFGIVENEKKIHLWKRKFGRYKLSKY